MERLQEKSRKEGKMGKEGIEDQGGDNMSRGVDLRCKIYGRARAGDGNQ